MIYFSIYLVLMTSKIGTQKIGSRGYEMNQNQLKIYVAHRYSCKAWNGKITEILASIGRAIDTGAEIAKLGHFPFVPHLDCLLAMRAKNLPEQYYKDANMGWLAVCDALFMVDSDDYNVSEGVKAEFDYAVKHGYPIYYNLDKLPVVPKKLDCLTCSNVADACTPEDGPCGDEPEQNIDSTYTPEDFNRDTKNPVN